MAIEQLVHRYVSNCKEREPIFVNDINVSDEEVYARNLAFHKLEEEKIIKLFKKDIYYKPKITPFGELGIDKELLIKREFLVDKANNVKGYITGPILWNEWNISTQIPNRKWISFNDIYEKYNNNIFIEIDNERDSIVLDNERDSIELNDLRVKLLKPKTKITNNNYKLLQILDVINQKDEIQDINWDNFKIILYKKLNELKKEEILEVINLSYYYNVCVENYLKNLLNEMKQIDYNKNSNYKKEWEKILSKGQEDYNNDKYNFNYEYKRYL